MRYFPLTEEERKEMLKFLGIKSEEELFEDIDKELRDDDKFKKFPNALDERDLIEKFKNLSERNTFDKYLSFLGSGAYNHFIPEVVNYLSSKGEFLTPYTPYQPEVSQGSLQAMFEYQTMMSMLTGMDVSNSSLYDGGTAAAEGVLLAMRKSRKNKILISNLLHPEYKEIVETYIQNLGVDFDYINYDKKTGKIDINDLEEKFDEKTACILFQSPNFFGVIEDSSDISDIAHKFKSFSVQVVAEAYSLAFLKPPSENGVDIVVGEAQSFGLPLAHGGPYLGFISAKKDFLRQMPGRIVGETKDVEGRRGYVLTLSTREQHIKRERATSNICSNQAWCALRAGIFLSTMGKKGLMDVSSYNHKITSYFVERIKGVKGVDVLFEKDYFNEVVVRVGDEKLFDKLMEKGIILGVELSWFYDDMKNTYVLNFTEIHRKSDVDKLIDFIGEVL